MWGMWYIADIRSKEAHCVQQNALLTMLATRRTGGNLGQPGHSYAHLRHLQR